MHCYRVWCPKIWIFGLLAILFEACQIGFYLNCILIWFSCIFIFTYFDYVGAGLLLWNQTRQRWVDNKNQSNKRHQVRDPKIRLADYSYSDAVPFMLLCAPLYANYTMICASFLWCCWASFSEFVNMCVFCIHQISNGWLTRWFKLWKALVEVEWYMYLPHHLFGVFCSTIIKGSMRAQRCKVVIWEFVRKFERSSHQW